MRTPAGNVSCSSAGSPPTQGQAARFTDQPPQAPDVWFDTATKFGPGPDLELAALEVALDTVDPLDHLVPINVNLSPAAVLDPRLPAVLARVAGRPVVIEITEHVPPSTNAATSTTSCADLRHAGVRLAVDDAGAGFASLRHIVRLARLHQTRHQPYPGLRSDPIRRALARALVDFSSQTGAKLIAEGIEDPTTWTLGAPWAPTPHRATCSQHRGNRDLDLRPPQADHPLLQPTLMTCPVAIGP